MSDGGDDIPLQLGKELPPSYDIGSFFSSMTVVMTEVPPPAMFNDAAADEDGVLLYSIGGSNHSYFIPVAGGFND